MNNKAYFEVLTLKKKHAGKIFYLPFFSILFSILLLSLKPIKTKIQIYLSFLFFERILKFLKTLI